MPEHTCGIDEVGRGPLAGPVTAAAVILDPTFPVERLRDSKALSPAARESIFTLLTEGAGSVGVGWVWPEEIDRINIHNASLEAMVRAYREIPSRSPRTGPDHVVVDGRFCPDLGDTPCEARVGGDRSVPEIMAASIIAKVLRDRWMTRYDAIDPRYGFAAHKGYPTPAHRAALARHGPCVIHRRSFRGVSTP